MPVRTHLPDSVRHGERNSEQKVPEKKKQGEHLKPWHFKPGQSGNPGGRPKHDVSAAIARAIFEQNPEAVYNALAKRLLKGDAYAFKELSDRGFGKLKDKVEVSTTDSVLEALRAGRARVAARKK